MIIASFNVNSLRARLGIVVEWLERERPDVLCVQETKVQDVDFPADGFDGTGYKCSFRGQKSYNGVAIFSRRGFDDVRFGFAEEPRDESRLMRVDVGGLAIVNTYVPQGYLPDSEKFAYKLNWFERLAEYFAENFKPDDPVVWVGDLNIAPEDRDVYDPKRLAGHVCFHPEVQKRLAKVMDWGFVDVFRKHCDEAGQYTFWDYRMPGAFRRNLGWRLDHIMTTHAVSERSTGCHIDRGPRGVERPSDHTPIVAEFAW